MNRLQGCLDAVKGGATKLGQLAKNAPEIGLIYNGVKFMVALVLADDAAKLFGIEPQQLDTISNIDILMALTQNPYIEVELPENYSSMLFNLSVASIVLFTSASFYASLAGIVAKHKLMAKKAA